MPEYYAPGDDLTVEIATGTVKPRYAVGDHLWVREAWRTMAGWDGCPPRNMPGGIWVRYEADGRVTFNPNGIVTPKDEPPEIDGKLRPGMFMCKWMSRIWRTVTAVRAERLQDISEEDAIAEGALAWVEAALAPKNEFAATHLSAYPTAAFQVWWDTIHGKGMAADNPWVFAYTFETEGGA